MKTMSQKALKASVSMCPEWRPCPRSPKGKCKHVTRMKIMSKKERKVSVSQSVWPEWKCPRKTKRYVWVYDLNEDQVPDSAKGMYMQCYVWQKWSGCQDTTLDLWSKGCKSWQKRQPNFCLQNLLSVLTLIRCPFHPVLLQWHLKVCK